MADNELKSQVSNSTLQRLLGATSPSLNNSKILATQAVQSRYSSREVKAIFGKELIPSPSLAQVDPSGIISYTRPAHDQSVRVKHEAESLRALAPEIKDAEAILVPSILSPNDMQQGALGFKVEAEGISEEVASKIEDLLDKHFNKIKRITSDMEEWMKRALFGAGSVPILMVPQRQLQDLIQKSIISGDRATTESYSFNDYSYERMGDLVWNTNKGIELNDPDKVRVTYESFSDVKKRNAYFTRKYNVTDIVQNTMVTCESMFNKIVSSEQYRRSRFDEPAVKNPMTKNNWSDYQVCVETLAGNIVDKLESGDFVRFSDNPEIIRLGEDVIKHQSKRLHKNLNEYFRDLNVQFQIDEMIGIPDASNSAMTKDQVGHPAVMILPSEAVIPVTIPGDKKRHIGYFILCDESGCPIDIDYRMYHNWYNLDSNTNASTVAMFGSRSDFFFGNRGRMDLGKMTANQVFDSVLDKYMMEQLSNLGLGGMDIDKGNSVSQCMLYRLFAQKRTQLVFVPEPLMVYYAFDYRENGTGKSKIEDVQFLLSLRTTFLVATIMSKAYEAIDHRIMELTLDNNVENVEQLLETLTQSYIEKRKFRFMSSPNEISRDITSASFSIIPKNLPGLNDFSFTRDEPAPRTGTTADPEMLEKLTELTISGYDVPPDAINKTRDEQYVKSIVLNNLFFAKKAMGYQYKSNVHTDKYTKTYVRMSAPLKKDIMTLISGDKTVGTDTSDAGNISTNNNSQELLNRVIEGISTYLPAPNVVADKAQYEEINEFGNSIQTVLEAIYPDDMIPSGLNDARDAMSNIRASIKSKLVREFSEKIGFVKNSDIPYLDEFSQTKFFDNVQTCVNVSSLINQLKSLVEKAANGSDGGGFGDDSSSDDSMGEGEDDSMSMDETADFSEATGDDDQYGDEPKEGSEEGSEPSDTSEEKPEPEADKPEEKETDTLF